MKCKNGLHEIDPNDTGKLPGRRRCRECYEMAKERDDISGQNIESVRAWQARNPEARRRNDHRWNTSPRKRAHGRCAKYGITLGQFERMGWLPPDVEEALNGNR